MNKIPILLVDAGTGNLHSVFHTLKTITDDVLISDKPQDIRNAEMIILPGVGAFVGFMNGLRNRGLINPLLEFIQQNKPLLGICVGMQALFESSEENGVHQGLGFLPGVVKKFPDFKNLKVPHTGWNQLWIKQDNLLLREIKSGDHVYFNHSFFCFPQDESNIAATTDYGIDFCSVIFKKNLYGVQFHPEKSQNIGKQLLSNFINIGRNTP